MNCKLEKYGKNNECIDISKCIDSSLLNYDKTHTTALRDLIHLLNEENVCEIAIQNLIINDEIIVVIQYIAANMPLLHRIKKVNKEEKITSLWNDDKYFDLALKTAFYDHKRYKIIDEKEFQNLLSFRKSQCHPCTTYNDSKFSEKQNTLEKINISEDIFNDQFNSNSYYNDNYYTQKISDSFFFLQENYSLIVSGCLITYAVYLYVNQH